LRQHFREQLHRQADDIRLAAFDDMHPAQPILVAECAGLAFPLPAGEVIVELTLRQSIHA
jgi:hypothetical protein